MTSLDEADFGFGDDGRQVTGASTDEAAGFARAGSAQGVAEGERALVF